MRAPERTLAAVLAALVVVIGLGAQDEPDPSAGSAMLAEGDVYRREVFRYQAGGRLDPFQPLLTGEDIGIRAQDLTLEGIVYSTAPGASVAIFSLPANAGRARLKVGQRLGSVTVVAIHPRRVDLREEQFGVARTVSLQLQRRGAPAQEGAAGPAAPAQAPAPQQPAAGDGRP
jgi:hypothetical protein